MKHLFLWAALLCTGMLMAQNKVLSKLPANGKSVTEFIPAGYDTIMTATGDLNKDKTADYVMALRSLQEDTFDPSKDNVDSMPARLLIVLLKTNTGYSLAATNDRLIMCKECGGVFGDPFAGISIANGILVVDHFGGSAWKWSYTHKFRYQQNDFYLIGETTHSFWGVKQCEKLDDFAGTDYKDVNLVTGAYEEKEITEDCVLKKNKKGKQKVQPLKKLSAFTIDN
jgi:hypothetical protein